MSDDDHEGPLVEVLFVGGPIGRQVLPLPLPEGEPPEDLTMEGLPRKDAPRYAYRYVRRVNPMGDGPYWMYVPAPEHADEPDPWRPTDSG